MTINSEISKDLLVRTQFDGREYLSVMEIFYYDEDGEEIIHERATGYCEGLITCADMAERYQTLLLMVEHNLKQAHVIYGSIEMENGC